MHLTYKCSPYSRLLVGDDCRRQNWWALLLWNTDTDGIYIVFLSQLRQNDAPTTTERRSRAACLHFHKCLLWHGDCYSVSDALDYTRLENDFEPGQATVWPAITNNQSLTRRSMVDFYMGVELLPSGFLKNAVPKFRQYTCVQPTQLLWWSHK